MKYFTILISLTSILLLSSFKSYAENLRTETINSEYTITNITVTSPTGSQDYCFNKPQAITWLTTGGSVSTVSIHLMLPNGQTINTTIANNIPNTGSFLWNGMATGFGNYLIKVSGTDDATPALVTGQTGVFALKDCEKPDLRVGIMGAQAIGDGVIGEGQRIKYVAKIVNSGVTAVQNPTVKMILDRPGTGPTNQFTTDLDATIGPNQRADFEKGFRVHDPGTYTVTIIIDPANAIDEMDETNNRRTRSFEVYPLPDLIVYIDNGKRPPVGREREIRIVVKNIGGSATSPYANFRLRSYVKQKGVKFYDIPVLGPGETHTIKRRHKWGTAGTKNLSARISYSQAEIKDNNNEVQASYFVRLPHHDTYSAAPKIKCSTGETFQRWEEIEE